MGWTGVGVLANRQMGYEHLHGKQCLPQAGMCALFGTPPQVQWAVHTFRFVNRFVLLDDSRVHKQALLA